MTYIINPMWFYWVSVIDSIRMATIAVLVISIGTVVVLAISIGISFYELGGYCGDDDQKYKKFFKIAIPLVIVSTLIIIFLPSKDTLIEMQIAKYATIENANMTFDAIKDTVDYIINAIKEVRA